MGGTVYLDRKDAELRLDGGALAVYVHGERQGTVPLAPVDRLVLIGNATVHANVLHRLCEEGIAVLLLSGKRQSYRGRLAGRLHAHVRLRLRQYDASRGPLATGWRGGGWPPSWRGRPASCTRPPSAAGGAGGAVAGRGDRGGGLGQGRAGGLAGDPAGVGGGGGCRVLPGAAGALS
ncbi:CRISPR-associated endonuclease Cas1 [Nitrospira sp. Kam-Ns4a]